MPIIIKLSDYDGETRFINAEKILSFQATTIRKMPCTCIETADSTYFVTETPDELYNLIHASMNYVASINKVSCVCRV